MQTLKRQVGLAGALLLGLGSMVGTGLYAVIPMLAGSMGEGVLLALFLAALLALCNGLNSAQLAANYPVSGGTYEYGYRLLTPGWGFLAGWTFLLAKSASAATAALALAVYLLGEETLVPIRILVALALVGLMTWLVTRGIQRTNMVNAVLVTLSIGAVTVFVLASWWLSGSAEVAEASEPFYTHIGWFEACAWLFVAYTGYGRIATLGEEIHEPRRNITRAMWLTLGVTAFLYILVAAVVATEPRFVGHLSLRAMARELDAPFVGWVVALGAAVAMLGVTLNLLLGLSRMLFAMARRGDLYPGFARVDAEQSPRLAVIGVGVLIGLLVLLGDLKTTWSFSAFTVLIYYGVCNMAALRLPARKRLYSKWVAWVGMAGCFFLALMINLPTLLSSCAIIFVGLVIRHWTRQHYRRVGV